MIDRPVRATSHCRHYNYEDGPQCEKGHSFAPGDALRMCCTLEPKSFKECTMRAEFTVKEYNDWQEYSHETVRRNCSAIAALPVPISERTNGQVECPNCGGVLKYARWSGGASLVCSTTVNCVGPVRFSIDRGADWPIDRNVTSN